MSRPTQDPQIRMNEILDAADKLFFSKGYNATTISDIAQKIGVAQGMLYYYFKSKEEVLERLLERYAADLVADIKAIYIKNNTSTEKIVFILAATLNKACYKNGLLLNMLYDVHNIHIKEKLFNQLELSLKPWLTKIVEEGIEGGEFEVFHAPTAAEYILVIVDFLSASIYKKNSDEILSYHLRMAEMLIGKALGAKENSIHIELTG